MLVGVEKYQVFFAIAKGVLGLKDPKPQTLKPKRGTSELQSSAFIVVTLTGAKRMPRPAEVVTSIVM